MSRDRLTFDDDDDRYKPPAAPELLEGWEPHWQALAKAELARRKP